MNTIEFWQGFASGALVNALLVILFTIQQQQRQENKSHDKVNHPR